MASIVITGATGLLGSVLSPLLRLRGHRVTTHGRSGVVDYRSDLADAQSACNLLSSSEPDAIVNLIGLTNVDACEAQPNAAYLANTKIVENLADGLSNTSAACHLVQISTDQVYDGPGPHREHHVALRNYYAFSKYAGELAARRTSNTTLRTSFFGRSRCERRQSLTDWLFYSLSNGDRIEVFDDVLFSPLSMRTVSDMIDLVLQTRPVGVFNLGSRNGMSKTDFAFAFAEELRLPTHNVRRATTNEVTFLKAYRPKDMRMDCANFEATFHLTLPDLRDEIKLAAKEYRE